MRSLPRAGRRLGGFISLGAAGAGAGLIALAATSDMRGGARLLTYAEGGVMLAYGTIANILLLSRESDVERQWRLYRTSASAPPVARWSVQPIVTPHGFVLTTAGSL